MHNQKSNTVKTDCMFGTHGRVVQNDIGEAPVFLPTRAPWAEPNGSVYLFGLSTQINRHQGTIAENI